MSMKEILIIDLQNPQCSHYRRVDELQLWADWRKNRLYNYLYMYNETLMDLNLTSVDNLVNSVKEAVC